MTIARAHPARGWYRIAERRIVVGGVVAPFGCPVVRVVGNGITRDLLTVALTVVKVIPRIGGVMVEYLDNAAREQHVAQIVLAVDVAHVGELQAVVAPEAARLARGGARGVRFAHRPVGSGRRRRRAGGCNRTVADAEAIGRNSSITVCGSVDRIGKRARLGIGSVDGRRCKGAGRRRDARKGVGDVGVGYLARNIIGIHHRLEFKLSIHVGRHLRQHFVHIAVHAVIDARFVARLRVESHHPIGDGWWRRARLTTAPA